MSIERKIARPRRTHGSAVSAGALTNLASQQACRARMCSLHGIAPKPPIAGLPTNNCADTPQKCRPPSSGARPQSTRQATDAESDRHSASDGKSENSAAYNSLDTPYDALPKPRPKADRCFKRDCRLRAALLPWWLLCVCGVPQI
jgi:hypothetical protein